MITLAPEDRRDLQRWLLSGAFVLFAHVGIAAAMVQWWEPIADAEPGDAIVVELASLLEASVEPPNDAEPEPERVEMPPEEPVEQIEPPPQPELAVTVPPEPEPPKPQEERPAPPPPPMRQAALPPSNSNAVPRWKTQVVRLLERNKRYPSEARARRQEGVAQLAFSIDRQGQVISSRLVGSSGSSALDKEALELARRAQPFPPPPPELAGAQIELKVPIRFNLQ
jgi:periplasmic protein TonB